MGLRSVLDVSLEPDLICGGLIFGEGPVWSTAENCLYWTDIIGDRILKWTPGKGVETVLYPSLKANGMTIDREERLVVAGWGSRSVWRREHDGSVTTLASHFEGLRLNSPNDVVVRSDGAVFWTDSSGALVIPAMEGLDVQRYLDFHGVFMVLPEAGRRVELVTDSMAYPNGLAFSPDESRLYVSDTWRHHVMVFDINPDSKTEKGEVFYELIGDEPGVADGVKVDVDGNVYVTGPGGIHVIDPAGKLLGRLELPGHVTNMNWGDSDASTLYVTTRTTTAPGAVYRVCMPTAGIRPGDGGP